MYENNVRAVVVDIWTSFFENVDFFTVLLWLDMLEEYP